MVFNSRCSNAAERRAMTAELSQLPSPKAAALRTGGWPGNPARVMIGATVLGLGGIKTHLNLLCHVLRRNGVEVQVFATGSNWDPQSVSHLESIGVQFVMPPKPVRCSHKLSALHAALAWPWRTPRQANSLYCISPGASQLLLHRLRPHGATSIN